MLKAFSIVAGNNRPFVIFLLHICYLRGQQLLNEQDFSNYYLINTFRFIITLLSNQATVLINLITWVTIIMNDYLANCSTF